jgi:hypothetical protein
LHFELHDSEIISTGAGIAITRKELVTNPAAPDREILKPGFLATEVKEKKDAKWTTRKEVETKCDRVQCMPTFLSSADSAQKAHKVWFVGAIGGVRTSEFR